ncbi:MAG TPA: MFS transporter, partial [Euryarchaeota archaeon]|nr:MFS transporter [Euryarchaeota archaeon]
GVEYTYRLSWEAVVRSFTTRTNVLIFVQGILGTVPWGVILYWLVSFLEVTRGLDKTSATFVLLILGVATVIGSLVGGILGDVFENRRRGGRAILTGLAIFIGMLATIGLVLYPIPSQLSLKDWIFIVIYSIVLIQLVSYAGPNVRAIISQVNPPEDRGTVFGVFNIMDNVGKAIGPYLAGLLIEILMRMGYTEPDAYMWTMIYGSLFWIPCAAVWIWLVRWYPRDKEALDKMLEERAKELLKRPKIS